MHALEFLVSDAELYSAQRVRFDQVDEFPGNDSGWQLGGQPTNHTGRGYTVEQTAGGAGEAHVHLGDTQLNDAVVSLLGDIDIVHPHYFSAAGIDDLLIEQVLAH